MTNEQVFELYYKKFGVPLQGPPLSWGHHSFTVSELAEYARTALKVGKPIDWSEYLAPLPPDAVS